MLVRRRPGQEAKVRAVHPAGRMGDRCHAAGAGHEGDRGARGQGTDDGAHVAAAVRARLVPWRRRSLGTEEHHVRDRHQARVHALTRVRGRPARGRHAEQSHVQAVHRLGGRAATVVVRRGARPHRVPHPRIRQDSHLHTHRTPPPRRALPEPALAQPLNPSSPSRRLTISTQ